MADTKVSQKTHVTAPALGDALYIVDDFSGTPAAGYTLLSEVKDLIEDGRVFMVHKTIVNPQSIFTLSADVPIFRAPAALTITRIHFDNNDSTPTAEFAGDLKFADDIHAGSYANATVIDVLDTTNGTFTATSGFDDATVPSGKYVYLKMDASPHTDIKLIYLEIYYTLD